MNDKQTYSVPVITYKEVEIDFKKIYDALVKKYPNEPSWFYYDTFGDNIDNYLKTVLDLKIEDEETLDEIWTDFGDWLDKNHK